MTSKKDEKKEFEFKQYKLTPEQIEGAKLNLEDAKIAKDSTDLDLTELLSHLEERLPEKQLDEQIAKTEKAIKDKKFDEKELTEVDISAYKIYLAKLKKSKALDLPMRKLRLQINSLRNQKERVDSPDKQIKKLEKQVRTGNAEVYESKNGGQNYLG